MGATFSSSSRPKIFRRPPLGSGEGSPNKPTNVGDEMILRSRVEDRRRLFLPSVIDDTSVSENEAEGGIAKGQSDIRADRIQVVLTGWSGARSCQDTRSLLLVYYRLGGLWGWHDGDSGSDRIRQMLSRKCVPFTKHSLALHKSDQFVDGRQRDSGSTFQPHLVSKTEDVHMI